MLVTHIEENSYRSTMIFESDGRILELDARPSDATALALRTGTDVFINETLLNEMGVDICNITQNN